MMNATRMMLRRRGGGRSSKRADFNASVIRLLISALLTSVPLPAQAYTCALTPAKDSVIIKTDNASDRAVSCKVDCTFEAPEGPANVSCIRQIPTGAEGWYVCMRPTGGKALEFADGSKS